MTTIVEDELEEIYNLDFDSTHHLVCIDCHPRGSVPLPALCGEDMSERTELKCRHPDMDKCESCYTLSPYHVCGS